MVTCMKADILTRRRFMKIFAAALLLISFVLTPSVYAGGRRGDSLPAPKLLAPGDNVDLGGLEALEFRWSPEGDRSSYRHFDFRLYKGHQTVEAGLLLHEEIPAGQTHFAVSRDQFEAGQTYAWSVKPVGAKKGRVNYEVFKVLKK